MTDTLRSRRFLTTVLGLVAILLTFVLAALLHVDTTLAGLAFAAIGGLTGTSTVAGAWHDRGIRVAAVESKP